MLELYQKYTKSRNLNLSFQQFSIFVEFFPALLMMLSDGIIDSQEYQYLEKLSKNIAKIFEDDLYGEKQVKELEQTFKNEFEYLSRNMTIWKEVYINTLKSYLTENPEYKNNISDMIELFAHTSIDVDEQETKMIDFLKVEFALEEVQKS